MSADGGGAEMRQDHPDFGRQVSDDDPDNQGEEEGSESDVSEIDWTVLLHTPESLALRIVRSTWFDSLMIGVIMVNLCVIVVETDIRAAKGSDGTVPGWLFVCNMAFLVIYSLEIIMRLTIEKCQYFRSKMNLMDISIVSLDVAANLLESVVGNLPSVAVLRIARAGRLIKVLQNVKAGRELWLMLHGMTAAMKGMAWALVLMFLILVMWSVVTVELVRPKIQNVDCEDCTHSFDDIVTSMFTWFDLIFIGEAWPAVAIPIMKETGAISVIIFFLAFVSVNLGLMNLILTVIVDSASDARHIDQDQKVHTKRRDTASGKRKLRNICESMDGDGNGSMSLEEIQTGWKHNESFRHTLEVMDVCEEDLQTIFGFMVKETQKESAAKKSKTCANLDANLVSSHKFVDYLYKMKTEEAQTMLSFIKFNIEDVHEIMAKQVQGLKDALERHRGTRANSKVSSVFGRATEMGDRDDRVSI